MPARKNEGRRNRESETERERLSGGNRKGMGKKDLYKAKREIQYHMNQTVQIVAVLFHLWIVLHMTNTPGIFSFTHAAL